MRDHSPPLIVAHRGASKKHPENSLDAFVGAATQGADGVELDVRITADGVAVVHHDPTIKILTLGEFAGFRPDATLVIADSRHDELPAHVPTLAAALTTCEQAGAARGWPLVVNVEIKSSRDEPGFDPTYGYLDAVVGVVRRCLPPDQVLVSSFDFGAIDGVHRLDPALPTALLASHANDVDRLLERVAERGHVAINPSGGLTTPELVSAAHHRSLAVNTWTIDDPLRMLELASWGVDGVITNVPDVAVATFSAGSDRRLWASTPD